MDFLQQKQTYLKQLAAGTDKSKKGCIDEEIKELVDAINSAEEYYTTSSCAGRILLYTPSAARKKNETQWLFVSHTFVSFSDFMAALKKLPEETVFFRFEPLILHVVCKDIAAAERLLQICNASGLKHSGAISFSKRIIVEVIGNDWLDAPIATKEKLLLSEEALQLFLADANEKMKKNFERIERLKKEIKEKE